MRLVPVLLAALALAGDPGTAPRPLAEKAPARVRDLYSRDGKVRGVCFVAGSRIDESVFLPLVRNNIEWISQTPFGWVHAADSPGIRLATHGGVYWGETDEGIVATAEMARKFGIRTMLKPHLWVAGWKDSVWSGEIRMKSEESWREWFDSYRRFILHYARLAQANGIEALAVGTELQGTTLEHEAEWRRVVREVRRVYKGRLTYAANWDREFEALPFWDALDFVGVQAYFPLSDRGEATIAELSSGWKAHLKTLERVASRTGKPVVFTEAGYRSSRGASVQPWVWHSEDPPDPEEQARCYEAMFRAVWGRPWLEGIFVWKWFPHFDTPRSGRDSNFTPQGKPAEKVMERWYSEATLPADRASPLR